MHLVSMKLEWRDLGSHRECCIQMVINLMNCSFPTIESAFQKQCSVLYVCTYFLVFIYFWERTRKRLCELGRAEGKGDRGSEAGSALSGRSPMRGLNSWTLRSWPELKSTFRYLTDWATWEPQKKCIYVLKPSGSLPGKYWINTDNSCSTGLSFFRSPRWGSLFC